MIYKFPLINRRLDDATQKKSSSACRWFGTAVLTLSQSVILKVLKLLNLLLIFKILWRRRNSYFSVYFLSPKQLWPPVVESGQHEGRWQKPFALCGVLLTEYSVQKHLGGSAYDQAIISHALAAGDYFLGGREERDRWESYLWKSAFVVVDLEIRLVWFIVLMKFPWAVC